MLEHHAAQAKAADGAGAALLPPRSEKPAASNRRQLAEALSTAELNPSFSPIVLSGLVQLLEFLLISLVGFGVYWVYLAPQFGLLSAYAVAIPGIAALTVIIFRIMDLYHVGALRLLVVKGLRLAFGWITAFMAAFAIIFFIKLEGVFSRVFFASWLLIGFACLLTFRFVVQILVKQLTRQGRLERRTAIVGGGAAGETLINALSQQPDSDLRICGVFDDRNDDRSSELVAGFPKLGNVDDLVEFARRTKLDLVVFALPVSAEARLLQMLRKLWVLPIDIRLAAHTQKLRFRPRNYSYIAGMPVFDMADKPIADWDVVLKWLFDKIVGFAMLTLLWPIMLIVAIAVKLESRGPILFKQRRYGFNNEMIEVYKFRSMYVECTDATASKLVTKNDPRVTRVGRFIRKTSLDELPQLFNVVFKGNLSLIGPRPHAVNSKAENRLYDEVVDGYFARHRVKPGITGWAQINGWRGETDTEDKIQKRVECDLYYIENWSVFLDAYILIMTPFALTKTENAY
ncbi:MAG: undecaprenyl-phosphate glucose phosphotransferase [Beijerinckiaceae bacterium]|nr:undecaprenyl-phosphate glucose phosphotransferase [Beijerinckiaceae bacterium]